MGRKLMLVLPLLCCHIVATLSENPPGQDMCGCTTDTLPHPRIVLLGPTGVGKSTFGNRLFGISEENGKEALCSQFGQRPYKFGVGHRSESHTVETSWMVGHYLGDPANPCIAIIDSPGTGDTEGRDCDHGIALAKGIKQVGSIDAFLLLFKGTNPRFSQSMQEQINLYTNIFGSDLFKNAITEFTYWSHDKKSARKRTKNRDGLNEDIQHQTWNREYSEKLGVPRKINTVFIDPVYDEEFADEREVEKYKLYTNKLWNLITNEFAEFKCEKRCKAPTGFFSGQPWLFEENAQQNKRLEDRASFTWQIWFAGCDGTGTKSYKIYRKNVNGTENVIYERVVDEDDKETFDDSFLLKSMNVKDEPADKFKTIQVTIDSVEDLHFGEYYVKNDKGNSQISKLKKIIDGEWADWGIFSDCSKTCIKGDEKPGTMTRVRECKPPQNGGLECKGMDSQIVACAHRHGENAEQFRQCPVDAIWSGWASGWGKCSANCIKEGGTVPQKTRSRVCQPERFGGKTCAQLEGEAKAEKLLLYTETQECTSLPKCPNPASLGPWSDWSSCSTTCYPEGGTVPQTTRKRTCKKASLSTSDELNADILTCEAFGEMEAYKNCKISACPVNAEWQIWGEWSACTTSCERGSRHRSRSYIPGRNGAEAKPAGNEKEKEDCNAEAKCPVAATWTWGTWSSCNIDCYKPDGNHGVRTREQSCQEEDPPHEFLNCKYPPSPGLQDTQPCPGIPKCSPLTRLYAEIHGGKWSGTDASVYLRIRNGDSGEECETDVLDSPGNSWATGTFEDFTGSELARCRNFYPSPQYNLEFMFRVATDGLRISKVRLEFGSNVYTGDSYGWFENVESWFTITRG